MLYVLGARSDSTASSGRHPCLPFAPAAHDDWRVLERVARCPGATLADASQIGRVPVVASGVRYGSGGTLRDPLGAPDGTPTTAALTEGARREEI
jgi:hypothetical protein